MAIKLLDLERVFMFISVAGSTMRQYISAGSLVHTGPV